MPIYLHSFLVGEYASFSIIIDWDTLSTNINFIYLQLMPWCYFPRMLSETGIRSGMQEVSPTSTMVVRKLLELS